MKILVLNSGSSNQKSCLYELGAPLPEAPPAPLGEGKLEWQSNLAVLEVRNAAGITYQDDGHWRVLPLGGEQKGTAPHTIWH